MNKITKAELNKLNLIELNSLRKKCNLPNMYFKPKDDLIKDMVTKLTWNEENKEYDTKATSNAINASDFKKFEYSSLQKKFEQEIFQSESNIILSSIILPSDLQPIAIAIAQPIDILIAQSIAQSSIQSNIANIANIANITITKKKQQIPKHIKTIIWNTYIGEDIMKHKCLCCKRVNIRITDFDAGHIISEKDGGTLEINNLRPICGSCNHAMGPMNMIEFIKKYVI